MLKKLRLTSFVSFEYVSNPSGLTQQSIRDLCPSVIRSIYFRALPDWGVPSPEPIDAAFRLQVRLKHLVIGTHSLIVGPGMLSPLRPREGLHVRAGENVSLIFTHPEKTFRIVGYVEILHLVEP